LAGPGVQYSPSTRNRFYRPADKKIDETMATCGGEIAKAAELLVMTAPALLRKIRGNVILRNKWIDPDVPVEPPKPLEPRDPEEGIRHQIRMMEEELEMTANLTHARRDNLRDTLARYHAILQRYADQRIEREKLAKGVSNPGAFRPGFDERRGPLPPRPLRVRLKLRSDAEIDELLKGTDEQQ
jgi:hypothetical protein